MAIRQILDSIVVDRRQYGLSSHRNHSNSSRHNQHVKSNAGPRSDKEDDLAKELALVVIAKMRTSL